MKKAFLAVLAAACCATAGAQTQFGAWNVGLNDDGLPFMYTVNDSGSMFGKWCDGQANQCFWLVLTENTCEDGARYSVMINTDRGSVTSDMTCVGAYNLAGRVLYRNAISSHTEMDGMAREASRIGFAMALASGDFRVVRFSMAGSTVAFTRWEALAQAAAKRRQRGGSGTRDTTL